MDNIAQTETGKFASEQAERLLGRLAFQINQTMKSRSAEAIHDLRVAVRRFSQALRVFKPCFRRKNVRKIARQLKQIMDLAGEVRNLDIAMKLVSRARRRNTTSLRSKLETQRRADEGALVEFLGRWVDRRSSLKWRRFVANSVTTNGEAAARTAIARTAQRLLPRMARDFFERGNEAAKTNASPRDLHEFRITAKKFRYTLELFISLYGSSVNSYLENIRRAQGLLGDVNDCETARRLLTQYKGADRMTSWLKKRQRRRIEEVERYWTTTFAAHREFGCWSARLSRPGGTIRQPRKPAGRTGLVSQAIGGRPIAAA